MKRIVSYVFCGIVIFSCLLNLCSVFGVDFLNLRVFRVTSSSMRPYLNVGDFILIKKSNKYQIGDVVTYEGTNHSFVTHRIVSINGDKFIAKGDSNNTNDMAISFDSLVGKMVMKLSILSFFSGMLERPISWIISLLIGIVVVFIIPGKLEKAEDKGSIVDDEII